MRKNDKPNISYHTPLNTKFRGKHASRRLCESVSEREQTDPYNECCCSVCTCMCMCARVCLVSLWKRSHRVNRVEINNDKSSIFSLSDRWFTQKTTKECNRTASRDTTNKTMSHSSELQSCLKFFSHAIIEWKRRNYILFTIWVDILYFRFVISHLVSVLFFFRLHGLVNKRTVDFGVKMITWCLYGILHRKVRSSSSETEILL